jgi:uncharacterized membrane protein
MSTIFAFPTEELPHVRQIGVTDIWKALVKGFADFKAMPSHLVFLGLIYPVVGLILARVTDDSRLLPLMFPLTAGFALLGPFAAVALYELSRRREQSGDVTVREVLLVTRSPAIGSILWLGALLGIIFLLWLVTAWEVYILTVGNVRPQTYGELWHLAFTTPAGWGLIIWGVSIGAIFAAFVLSISAISFPLLLDKNVGVTVAIETSIRAVFVNPGPMALWGLIVAAALVVGSLPLLIGLAVVIPILGHATWHLYRALVGPASEGHH